MTANTTDPRPKSPDETVLITGAGRGIGRAMAAAFAAAGARVAMVARSRDELSDAARAIEGAGGIVRPWVADVTDVRAMERVIEDVERTFGPIGVLINNAGSATPLGPLSDVDHDEAWRTVEVNLRGPMLCMRFVLPRMQWRRHGRIINVASGAGIMSYTYFSAYVASKTALVRLTECIASEAAPYGVTVFAMDPGTVATAMSGYSVSSEEGQRWIPWFRRIFDEGLDAPPERAAVRAIALASGRADALSGRYIPLAEDLDRLIANADPIKKERRYSLRITTLDAPPAGPVRPGLAEIRARAETPVPDIVHLRATFPVSRERAFGVWTDSRAIEKWFLPETGARWIRAPMLEATPGGAFSFEVASDTERYRLFGRCVDAEPARRLVLEWCWDTESLVLGRGSGSIVYVEFVDATFGTEVIVRHEKLPSEAIRDAYIAGWSRCLTGMQRLFASEAVGLR
jgi:NAD(P)-dependent dehydrogenase (short-subunit alcohol dehydrogenase family)/uncharacterized protein YndB with AHSA1/START domain